MKKVVLGSASCECPSGWVIDGARRNCIDQREDSCFDEYRGEFCLAPRLGLMNQRNCCCTRGRAWGSGEGGECEECPNPGSTQFSKLCPLGMGRGGSGEDFNECEMMRGLCEGGSCINTDGSYRCICPKGYGLDPTGAKCVDIDECLQSRACGNGTCRNVEGGFECSCSDGFAPGPSGWKINFLIKNTLLHLKKIGF